MAVDNRPSKKFNIVTLTSVDLRYPSTYVHVLTMLLKMYHLCFPGYFCNILFLLEH